jgi:hypothetical protein
MDNHEQQPQKASNAFSVQNLLSPTPKPNELIKPVPMITSTGTAFPYCFIAPPNCTNQPNPMAIAAAMAALNGGIVDPSMIMMLQSLSVNGVKKPENSPTDSTTSSPQCMAPFWLTPTTEISSSSSLGNITMLFLYSFQTNQRSPQLF